jgi:hypothetical protein
VRFCTAGCKGSVFRCCRWLNQSSRIGARSCSRNAPRVGWSRAAHRAPPVLNGIATLATFLSKALTRFFLLVTIDQPDSGQLEQNNQLLSIPLLLTAISFALTFDPSLNFQYKFVGGESGLEARTAADAAY